MYRFRDIAILGGGGCLAILCLILPFGLAGKIVCAGIVLVAALVIDRLPIKAGLTIDRILSLRMRKSSMPKKYNREAGGGIAASQQRGGRSTVSPLQDERRGREVPQAAPARPVVLVPPMDDQMDALPPAPVYLRSPLAQAAEGLSEGTLGIFITVVLVVIAIYFFYWLYHGGLPTLTADFASIQSLFIR